MAKYKNFCTLFLFDFFNEEELEDSDEIVEVIANARDILSPFGPLVSIHVSKSYVHNKPQNKAVLKDCVVARFESFDEALSAYASLQKLVLGGQPVHTMLCDNDNHEQYYSIAPSPVNVVLTATPDAAPAVLYIENMVSEADVSDPDEAAELLSDVATLCDGIPSLGQPWLERRPVTCVYAANPSSDAIVDAVDAVDAASPEEDVVVCVGFHSSQDAQEAQRRLQGMVFGGRQVTVSVGLPASAAPAKSTTVAAQPTTTQTTLGQSPEQSIALAAADRLASGAAPPKLPKRVATPSETARATDALDLEIYAFLSSLADFQERAEAKDPVKAKAKPRFVIGLKQVLNGVKSKRARLVLLAPDTEASDELDKKINDIMKESTEQSVPVMYCLSRRKLGKAVHVTVKHCALAVYDPTGQGVYETFSKLIRFIEEFKSNMGRDDDGAT